VDVESPVESRRCDIDWLRIGATLLLFPFHAARPFDHAPWHVKSPLRADVFDVVVGFVHQFHMPLFFVLAGWSIERSLRTRRAADVRRERCARLLVPFLAGVALVSPPQAYVEAITQRGFTGTFAAYLPRFFGSLAEFSWHHLWFLIYLFTFTMLYLPWFARVAHRPRARVDVRAWHLYAAIVPFALVQVGLRWRWPGYQNLYDDWANFAWYSLFFVAGFTIGRLPPLEDVIERERRRCAWGFALATIATLPLLAVLRGRVGVPGAGYVAYQTLSAIAGVTGVAALLGYGRRLASIRGTAFAYLRAAALPLYILHQTVIVVLGYWIFGMGLSLAGEYVVLLVGAVVLTFALHHLVVRPLPPLRLAFGMRPPAVGRAVPGSSSATPPGSAFPLTRSGRRP
jgi:fucose 4-O-acetylase-like acetyltransferase